jgi:hypothetical protein
LRERPARPEGKKRGIVCSGEAEKTTSAQPHTDDLPGEHLTKKILEGSSEDDGFVSHPQLNGWIALKVQA